MKKQSIKMLSVLTLLAMLTSLFAGPVSAADTEVKTGPILLPKGQTIYISDKVKDESPVIDAETSMARASSSYTLKSGAGVWISFGQRPTGSSLTLNISKNSNSCGLSVQMYYGSTASNTSNTYGENYTCYTMNRSWTVNRASQYWRVYVYNWGETSTTITYSASYSK